jgi:hypothetical protein
MDNVFLLIDMKDQIQRVEMESGNRFRDGVEDG